MEYILKELMKLFFPYKGQEPLHAVRARRGRMTLLHVMALNNVNKACVRPVAYGVMGLKKGASGYGDTLFQAKYRPGRFFSMNNARILCRETARECHFDILFLDSAPWVDKVMVLCPRCKNYWIWEETLENDLRQESGRVCSDCRETPSMAKPWLIQFLEKKETVLC